MSFVPTETELSLLEELERTRTELYEERRRFNDATTIIGEQAERIFQLNAEKRTLASLLADARKERENA